MREPLRAPSADPRNPYAPTAEDAEWREVQDPHNPDYWWRCKHLVLEFQWRPSSGVHGLNGWRGGWYDERYTANHIFHRTELRDALWRDLFIHPANAIR